jgi:sterol desaturase/sphingolipid hydroxylase (fatty acid hydroxylase superfamily)
VAGCFFTYLFLTAGIEQTLLWVNTYFYWPAEYIFKTTIFTSTFALCVSAILILERIKPVNPEQKTISVGISHDGVWLVMGLLFEGIVVTGYAEWLKALCENHLDFLKITSFETHSEIARFAIGITFSDFLAWLQHWVKHKVPLFWYFHQVHHSQRELNLFTDFRFHFFEYLVSRLIVLVPLVSLGISTPHIVAYAIFATWITRFYHANIKTNLGIMRYIFVTPQSHRVHHSIEVRHQDKNFGVIFSFWDRIFGTQVEDYCVYPKTGINDPSFPIERETSLSSLVITPLQQLIYPIVLIFRGFRRKTLVETSKDG